MGEFPPKNTSTQSVTRGSYIYHFMYSLYLFKMLKILQGYLDMTNVSVERTKSSFIFNKRNNVE